MGRICTPVCAAIELAFAAHILTVCSKVHRASVVPHRALMAYNHCAQPIACCLSSFFCSPWITVPALHTLIPHAHPPRSHSPQPFSSCICLSPMGPRTSCPSIALHTASATWST
ncbi:hypothetical protein JB92DRAFT_2880168 [Gautieria morchelliformis]|nr:hypothetical protein JB92DRAFT_2880168 [Gautieria morchelliformis]